MKEDVVILLDRLNKALVEFSESLKQGKDTDIVYGDYLNDLLRYTAENYIKIRKYAGDTPTVPYKTLFVILPGNVPMVFFEVLPISLIYKLKTFFKFPKDEKKLYLYFIQFLKQKYPAISDFFHGSYMEHTKIANKTKEFDFVFAYGSYNLAEFLHDIARPYRFFGPGFSIGIAHFDINIGIINDTLFFDQRGCLSMKILFYKKNHIIDKAKETFKKNANRIPPTSSFSKDRFLYRLHSLVPYGNIILKGNDYAIFEIKTDRMPDVYLPERTLLMKKVKNNEEIIEFLGPYINMLQAISTDDTNETASLKKYPAFITTFGQLQFQPYNFLFKRGVNLNNIFTEVDNVDTMGKKF